MVPSIDVPYGQLSASAEGKVLVTRPSGRAAPKTFRPELIGTSLAASTPARSSPIVIKEIANSSGRSLSAMRRPDFWQ
jgi:hypothetical protein